MEKLSRTLLVVDDEPTIVFAMTRFFGARGFSVESAADMNAAVDHLDRCCPEVAIVDLRLGGLGDTKGLEVLEQLRARCPNTAALLLTAYGSRTIEAEARRRGADLVLQKPTPLPSLANDVARLLESRADRDRGGRG